MELPTAPQRWVKCREHISLYIVYVINKVPLPYLYIHEAKFQTMLKTVLEIYGST